MVDFLFIESTFYEIWQPKDSRLLFGCRSAAARLPLGCLSAVGRLPSEDFEFHTFYLHALTARAKMTTNILMHVFDENTFIYFHNDTYHQRIDEILSSGGHFVFHTFQKLA